MLAVIEIDVRHFIKPAFVPVAVDMAREGYEQCLIYLVPHQVFVRPRFRMCFREGPRHGFNELLEIGRKFAQVILDWYGHGIRIDIALRAVRRLEPIQMPPDAPARIAADATNDDVFYPQAILDIERPVEIQMLDAREILSGSASRFDLREGLHRLVAICAGLVPFPQRLFVSQSDAELVSHEALPSPQLQRSPW